MPNYGHIVKSTDPEAYSGGYKNVFMFAPRRDFTTIEKPAPGLTPAMGDALKINAAHVFPEGKGFIEHECKSHSVKLTGATVGDDGAKEMEWTSEYTILGDSASTQEQLMRQLNDDVICLLKDADCSEGEFVQLGNDCFSPEFDVKFDGKTTKEGKKEYVVTVKCRKKYFYTANYTKAA